jgi:virulence-associated protein VapD
MTSELEKVFMNWVLKTPEHFKNVKGYYFENEDIKFVYDIIRNEYMGSLDKIVPSKTEILTLVKLFDKTDKIQSDFIRALLKIDWDKYRDEFVVPRFKAWVLSNSAITGLVDSYEKINNLDKTNINNVQEVISDIRGIIDDSFNIQLDKGSIGLDFDDVESHNQELEVNKITSGFPCFDKITEGGWDRKTFNVLMGGPGSGKCCINLTKITVKNKRTGEIKEVDMETFFSMTRGL